MRTGRDLLSIVTRSALAFLLLAAAYAIGNDSKVVEDVRVAPRAMMNAHQGMMGPGMMGGMHRGMMQQMMRGILPPGIDPSPLPDADSSGASLLRLYCTQCHSLPGPGMHTAAEWPRVVGRMNMRMQMMGRMMGAAAPNPAEVDELLAYLVKHAQQPIEPGRYPDLDTPEGRAFSVTCAQCHALPDPRQHTDSEWPAVVGRMRSNMAAMGRPIPDEMATAQITDFLRRHSLGRK